VNGAAVATNAPTANGHVQPVNPAFHQAIKAKLATEGKTVVWLAAQCGISRAHLSNALAGRARLNAAAISQLRSFAEAAP